MREKQAERFRLPPLVTASNWLNLWSSLHQHALRARGADASSPGPSLTNREAVALVRAFVELGRKTRDGFPLASQFAAVAYGWSPQFDAFKVSPAQGARLYPAEAGRELWEATKRIAADLEQEQPNEPARVELDASAFGDLTVQGQVREAMLEDGAKVTAFVGAEPPVKRAVKAAPATRPSSPKKDNTLLLVGLAVGALVLMTRRKPRRRRITRRK